MVVEVVIVCVNSNMQIAINRSLKTKAFKNGQ